MEYRRSEHRKKAKYGPGEQLTERNTNLNTRRRPMSSVTKGHPGRCTHFSIRGVSSSLIDEPYRSAIIADCSESSFSLIHLPCGALLSGATKPSTCSGGKSRARQLIPEYLSSVASPVVHKMERDWVGPDNLLCAGRRSSKCPSCELLQVSPTAEILRRNNITGQYQCQKSQ